jgi:hypothetical protein
MFISTNRSLLIQSIRACEIPAVRSPLDPETVFSGSAFISEITGVICNSLACFGAGEFVLVSATGQEG